MRDEDAHNLGKDRIDVFDVMDSSTTMYSKEIFFKTAILIKHISYEVIHTSKP
jgi:hypothetical protein